MDSRLQDGALRLQHQAAGPALARAALVTVARGAVLGANTPWPQVRFTPGLGTRSS
jgi:hypothetical protein